MVIRTLRWRSIIFYQRPFSIRDRNVLISGVQGFFLPICRVLTAGRKPGCTFPFAETSSTCRRSPHRGCRGQNKTSRAEQDFLCFFQCVFWQAGPQYQKVWQQVAWSLPPAPQAAQALTTYWCGCKPHKPSQSKTFANALAYLHEFTLCNANANYFLAQSLELQHADPSLEPHGRSLLSRHASWSWSLKFLKFSKVCGGKD